MQHPAHQSANAHLGIHHPFSARHGTPVPFPRQAQRERLPLHERMYAPSLADLLRGPMPQPPDASGEERMYPESIGQFLDRLAGGAGYYAENSHGSTAFDASGYLRAHVRNRHAGIVQYLPEPEAGIPYYRIGVRPLDTFSLKSITVGDSLSNDALRPDLSLEHMQFLGNDGSSNFGLSKDGTGQDGVFSESRDAMRRYLVEPRKFRKEYIDRARREVEEEWLAEKAAARQEGRPISRYHLLEYNCQRYVAQILLRAEILARRDGIPLVIE